MNREENKKKTSDDKVGPIYCSIFRSMRAWKKGSYSHFIMVCVTRTTVTESPSVFQALSRPCSKSHKTSTNLSDRAYFRQFSNW